MFRPAKPVVMDKKRHVVLAIKTTGSKDRGYDPAENQITEIACVEMKDGKTTGQTFEHRGVFDPKAQAEFLAFINKEADTKIIVHYKKFVLDFLRHELSEEGNRALATFTTRSKNKKDRMENMISKAARLAKDGKYVEGAVPFQVENDKQKLMPSRKFYQFTQVCEGMGVHTRTYQAETATAMQEAEMLAKAEYNRLQHVVSVKLGK